MEPITMASVSAAVLSQGITFLYTQAGEILKARRERGKVPVVNAAVVEERLEPVTPDWDTVEELSGELAELRRRLSDHIEGGLERPDPADAETVALAEALRRGVELVLGQRITFQGEARELAVAGRAELGEVQGYAAGVRARWIAGGRVAGEARADTIGEGGRVIGVDADRIGGGGPGGAG